MSGDFRIEHDSMGDVEVPSDALWRAQTQRAVQNFPVSGRPLPPALIHALARIKAAAARANADLDVITAEQRDAIVAAVAEIVAGHHDEHFPIDVFQTGSGTSTNMNANEVVSSLTARNGVECHPNDVVNASQSSNDAFPSAIHVAAVLAAGPLDEAIAVLADALTRKAEEYADAVKSGRTHLMDATPVTLGQELGGYAATATYARERLAAALPRARELPLGGTAVGTGINTPPGFPEQVIAALSESTGTPFTEARNHFEAQGTRDSLVELSGVLKTYAVGLVKICNDLRWMGSGPTAGLAEIHLQDLQPGSSIMPGKVNPVIPEVVNQVAYEVIGNDVTVTFAAEAGQLQLNAFEPIIAHSLFKSVEHLRAACLTLAERCVVGITANVEHMRAAVENSIGVVTALNPYIGYANATAVAAEAHATGGRVYDIVLQKGLLSKERLDEILRPEILTRPQPITKRE